MNKNKNLTYQITTILEEKILQINKNQIIMNEITTAKMKQMKLYAKHDTFKNAIESGKTGHYLLDQFIAMLIYWYRMGRTSESS